MVKKVVCRAKAHDHALHHETTCGMVGWVALNSSQGRGSYFILETIQHMPKPTHMSASAPVYVIHTVCVCIY